LVALSNVNLWESSRGSILAIEMDNGLRYCLVELGYCEDEIVDACKKIGVVTVSNLASFERIRLFSTVSVTGSNDKVAKKYIHTFPESNENPITQHDLSPTHCAVLATIPDKIITIDGLIIEDSNCHYTPLYITLRQDANSNELPLLVRDFLAKMLTRETEFCQLEKMSVCTL
jgi:hypothetical protein